MRHVLLRHTMHGCNGHRNKSAEKADPGQYNSLSPPPPPPTRTTPSFRESNPSPFDHVSKEIGDDGDNARRYTLEQSTLYSTILLLYQLNLPSTTLLPYQLNRPSRPTSSPLNTEQIHTHTKKIYKKMCF